MSIARYDTQYFLKTAGELAQRVAAEADRIDADRQITPDLAAEMADKGFLRLLVPRSLGGAELDHPDYLEILKIFAAADGSTAWTMNQLNVFATNSVRIPQETARQIWADDRACISNGPPTSSVRAVPVEGGYRLSGRWNFSSGSTLATWVAALVPSPSAPPNRDGTAARGGARIMLIPREEVRWVDSWHVNGLRGTGSFSFEVEDHFIPRNRTYEPDSLPIQEDGPLYVIPRTTMFGAGFATVALGIARASLATAVNLASTKVPGRSATLLGEQQTTHRLLGQGEATWRSAQAFLQQSHRAAWESACRDRALTLENRINLRLSCTHAIRMASEVVDIAYNLCGSGAIFASNPIHRRFHDMKVITQHLQGRPTHYETAGQYLLGMDPAGNY
jgi:indole-3-acetate monooxygenase